MPDEYLKRVGDYWQGECQTSGQNCLLQMTPQTLEKYIQARLETHLITKPTNAQYIQAFQACRCTTYWDGCQDANVHRIPVRERSR